MKSLLHAMLIGFLMFGYGEGTAQIKGKQSSVVAEVDDVVGGVMDNYTSIESGFAEAENALRSSDAPVVKILDDLTKIVSGERAESEGMKDQLLTLKKKLEDRKKKIDLAAGKASPSMRESYGLALSEIEGKLDGKIKPLLDFDFQYLEKFEKDLSAATLEWKEFLGNVNGVLEEGLIRNELVNRISDHFEENMAKPIEERRSKWGSVVKARKERVQKEQIDGRPSFVEKPLPKKPPVVETKEIKGNIDRLMGLAVGMTKGKVFELSGIANYAEGYDWGNVWFYKITKGGRVGTLADKDIEARYMPVVFDNTDRVMGYGRKFYEQTLTSYKRIEAKRVD